MYKKYILWGMLTIIMAFPMHEGIAKEKKSLHPAKATRSGYKRSTADSLILKKKKEIELLQKERAQLNARYELKIQNKYQEIQKISGYSQGYSNNRARWAEISYP